jgi:hypothetical protein
MATVGFTWGERLLTFDMVRLLFPVLKDESGAGGQDSAFRG